MAQVEEPGERGGAPGARGGVALTAFHAVAVICSSCLLRSPSGKQDDGDQNDAENDSRDPGPLPKGQRLSP